MSETQTVENPVEENPIVDLINHSLNQDYNKANQIFGDILGHKLDMALEQEKIKMADLVYNADNDLDNEDGDDTETDQGEFDFESDDTEGTEEDESFEEDEDEVDDQESDDEEKDV